MTVRFLPYFLFAGLIIGQLLRLGISAEASSAILAIDIINTIYVVGGLSYALATKKALRLSLSLILLGAFLAWMLLSLFIGSWRLESNELFSAFLYAARYMLMCGTIVVTLLLFQRPLAHEPLLKGIMTSGIVLAILGFAQLIAFPNFTFMLPLGWDPHIGRMLSTFFDPNFLGMFLVIIFSYALVRALYYQTLREVSMYGGLALFILAAILLTYSRSSYLALVVSTGLILLIRSWKIVIIVGAIGVALGASSDRVRNRVMGAVSVDATAQARILSWKNTVQIIRDNPVTGVGYNAFGPTQLRYGTAPNLLLRSSQGSDSSLLLIAATTGSIGLILFLAWYIALLSESVFVYKHATLVQAKRNGLLLIGILPAYLVHSQFTNSLFYPLIFIPVGFLIAAMLAGRPHGKT